MTIRTRLRPAILASALGLAPMLGCLGASDDKVGSGSTSKAGGSGIDPNYPIESTTQQHRQDAGDKPSDGGLDGRSLGRPVGEVDVSKTGGLGGTRDNKVPGPGETGPRSSSAPDAGPK